MNLGTECNTCYVKPMVDYSRNWLVFNLSYEMRVKLYGLSRDDRKINGKVFKVRPYQGDVDKEEGD